MMYNEYDNEKFFEEYAKMPRSIPGMKDELRRPMMLLVKAIANKSNL